MSANQIEIAGLPAFGTDSATARRLGAVMGLAVGDALGTTFEFSRIDQPSYPALAIGPATDALVRSDRGDRDRAVLLAAEAQELWHRCSMV